MVIDILIIVVEGLCDVIEGSGRVVRFFVFIYFLLNRLYIG